ncbi:hypothetical protein H4R18_002771 [Coemansia javaensis]|uniref:Protein kinase domain-containing protein n=1 Tax=Coemansia javaensis TaxID=2761396 RepID=A0A9W8HGN7_9FUNG|nr:hypothetical protein H4R18_002771 [Coemansia javaensis]
MRRLDLHCCADGGCELFRKINPASRLLASLSGNPTNGKSTPMEVAMYREDRERLGTSAKDKLMRERLTTAISAVKALAAVQKKRDPLLLSAQEDAARLGNELHALKRKNPDSANDAALSHAERLKIAENKHDRAMERILRIVRDDDAPAKEAVQPSTDAPEGKTRLLLLPGPAAGIEVDMTHRLSQSLQGRKLRLILDRFKKTFATTWNDDNQDVKAVVKLTPRNDTNQMRSTRNEVATYQHLHSLQGTCIPRFLDYGCTELDGKEYFAIVMERIEGRDLAAQEILDFRPSLGWLSDQEKAACREGLARIHELGVSYWDIRGSNLMFRDNLPGPNRIPVFIGITRATVADELYSVEVDGQRDRLEQIFTENDPNLD